jgi:hypothetical protein
MRQEDCTVCETRTKDCHLKSRGLCELARGTECNFVRSRKSITGLVGGGSWVYVVQAKDQRRTPVKNIFSIKYDGFLEFRMDS